MVPNLNGIYYYFTYIVKFKFSMIHCFRREKLKIPLLHSWIHVCLPINFLEDLVGNSNMVNKGFIIYQFSNN